MHSNGVEWIVDATGCPANRLRDRRRLTRLFQRLVLDLELHPIGHPHWHRFPEPGGLTGLWMLQESHLACHTFPEFGALCLNLFCCRPRPAWDWSGGLGELVGALHVSVRSLERRYVPLAVETV